LSGESLSIEEILARSELAFLLGKTKVTMRSSLENIQAGDFKIESLKEGEMVDMPRWAAEELVNLEIADIPEEPFETEILKALSREKMLGPFQLSNLRTDFYQRMQERLSHLDSMVRAGKVKKDDFEKLRAACYDLVGLRLGKLMSLASSSTTAHAIGDKLTQEETSFFTLSRAMSKEWKEALLGGA
jgi:hypothetical protein